MDASRDESMRKALTWTLFGVGFFAAYFVSTALPVPLPWYYPVQHRWALEVRPQGLAVDFFGRLMFSLAGGAVIALLGRISHRFIKEQARARSLAIAGAWSAALLLLVAGLYVHKLVGRLPSPAPLPPGYVAR